MIEQIGAGTVQRVENLGRFARFSLRSGISSSVSLFRGKSWPLVFTQMNTIGVQSAPVVMITGAFVGMVLAIQAYDQLAGMGLEERLGVLINISVVK